MTNGFHTQEEHRIAWEWLSMNARFLDAAEARERLFMDPAGYAVFEAPGLKFDGHEQNEYQIYLAKPACPEEEGTKLAWNLYVPCVKNIEISDTETAFTQYAGPVWLNDGEQMRVGDLALWSAKNTRAEDGAARKQRKGRRGPSTTFFGDEFMASDAVTRRISTLTNTPLSIEECTGKTWFSVNEGRNRDTVVLYITPDGTVEKLSLDLLNVHNAIASLVENNGSPVIRGRDILKQLGSKNPYQEGQKQAIERCFAHVFRLMNAHIAIDVRRNVENIPDTEARKLLQPIIRGDIEMIGNIETGALTDFELILTPRNPSDLFTALPLYEHAKGVHGILQVRSDVRKIGSGSGSVQERITTYISMRIAEKKTNDTILVNTMLNVLGIDPTDRKARHRAVESARNILNELMELPEVASGARLTGYEERRKGKTVEAFVLAVSRKTARAKKVKKQ